MSVSKVLLFQSSLFWLNWVFSVPTLNIEDGVVVGREAVTSKKTFYHAFQGIPYAEPPLGSLRFQPPKSNRPWVGVHNATYDRAQCIQGSDPSGSEDCLYLNVYSPLVNSSELLPVFVWFYGGGFISGNASYESYNPDYFLDQELVFVSFNYRLGIFGFMSTGDEVQPGNNGLRDMLLTLKWVQRNIEKFGGDPSKVTLGGQSAGAVSISYLLQSSRSQGLFHRAILASGTSLVLWGLTRSSRNLAFLVGKSFDINTDNSSTLVQKLREVDAYKLQSQSYTEGFKYMLLNNPLHGLFYGPVMEFNHDDALITGNSHEKLQNGDFLKVPLIIGFNSNEAARAEISLPDDFIPYLLSFIFLGQYDLFKSKLVPVDMNVSGLFSRILAGFQIHNFYFGIFPLALQLKQVVLYVSDDQFVRPICETVNLMSKYTDVYFYQFSFEGNLSGYGNRILDGAGHGEELAYIFKNDLHNNLSIPHEDFLMSDFVVQTWSNFIKLGNPTPEGSLISWPKAGSELHYLNYDVNITIEKQPNHNNMTFWKKIYKAYGKPPYTTY